jgi:hypothetical protein
MKKSTKQQVLIPGDRVKIKREEGDMDSEDFGMSGLVIHSNLKRFGPYLNHTFYVFGNITEYPEWCAISTDKLVLGSTKHYCVRIDNLIKVEDENG